MMQRSNPVTWQTLDLNGKNKKPLNPFSNHQTGRKGNNLLI